MPCFKACKKQRTQHRRLHVEDLRIFQKGFNYSQDGPGNRLVYHLSVVADSFVAVDCLLRDRPQDAQKLIDALACSFEGYPVLLNIGTGSQISLWTEQPVCAAPLETRPYPLGGYLLVGAALCGGKAWALTERFFSDAVFLLTGQRISAYEGLERMVAATADDSMVPIISTTFDGTRQNPEKRACIENLSADNFTRDTWRLVSCTG